MCARSPPSSFAFLLQQHAPAHTKAPATLHPLSPQPPLLFRREKFVRALWLTATGTTTTPPHTTPPPQRFAIRLVHYTTTTPHQTTLAETRGRETHGRGRQGQRTMATDDGDSDDDEERTHAHTHSTRWKEEARRVDHKPPSRPKFTTLTGNPWLFLLACFFPAFGYADRERERGTQRASASGCWGTVCFLTARIDYQ